MFIFVCLFVRLQFVYFSLFYQGEHQAAVDIYDEEVRRTFRFELSDDFSFRFCSSFPCNFEGKKKGKYTSREAKFVIGYRN